MQTISFSYRVGLSTVCGIIDTTCDALWTTLYSQYISRPSTPSEWKHISKGFEEILELSSLCGSNRQKAYCNASSSSVRVYILQL